MKRAEQLKQIYNLQPHEEGGYFTEVYTAPFEKDGRALSGSIYFLLDGEETSRFHRIDCDEVWYFHEGCGMKITVLMDGSQKELLLGSDLERGDRAMVVVPKGSVFAAAADTSIATFSLEENSKYIPAFSESSSRRFPTSDEGVPG